MTPVATDAPRRDEWQAGEAEYLPPDGRAHTPVAFGFRCAPMPPTVDRASQLPEATTAPDDAIRTALAQRGLSAAQITAFGRDDDGFPGLRPVAAMFGATALGELLGRLRYSVAQLLAPPTTYKNPRDVLRVAGPALLAPRLLLAIPGHFRELARRSARQSEAYVLETFGWLVMRALRESIATATGRRWWLPPAPTFAGLFPQIPIQLTPPVQALIRGPGIVDATVIEAAIRGRFRAWRDGLPGRLWRLETGREASAAGADRPFYPELVQVPDAVDVAGARTAVQPAWERRRADVERRLGARTPAATKELTTCTALALPPALLRECNLRGLGVTASRYPQLAAGAEERESVAGVFALIEPTLRQVFETIRALGWNDLLFQTGGVGCFRGTRHPRGDGTPDPESARSLSSHSLGIAVDFNSFENMQRQGVGSMDPRIVALFETFRFKWGRCFGLPDPMHFEYCGATCAPAPAAPARRGRAAAVDADAVSLLDPAPVADERFSEPSENWLPAPVHVVLDRDARIRSGPPDFRPIGGRIPYWTRVWLEETQGEHVRVKGADGTAYGWTQASNVGLFFKDLPHLTSAALVPATTVPIESSWSERRQALAQTYNRLGGLMAYVRAETSIPLAAVLAVWYVESAGRSHTVGRAVIRFENHLFFDAWGRAHPDVYDRHFQHGGRAGIAGRRWENHRWREDPAQPFARFHGDQNAEYRALVLATGLSNDETALSCISIGGPQILVSNSRMIGYDTGRAMYDAFQAGERAQVLGFFDFCRYRFGHGARRGELLRDLTALRWEDFTRGYNGDGQVTEYAGRLRSAYADALHVVPAPAASRAPSSPEHAEGTGPALPNGADVVSRGEAYYEFVRITSKAQTSGGEAVGFFWILGDAVMWQVPDSEPWTEVYSWLPEKPYGHWMKNRMRLCRVPCTAKESQDAADAIVMSQNELLHAWPDDGLDRYVPPTSTQKAPSVLPTPHLYDILYTSADVRIPYQYVDGMDTRTLGDMSNEYNAKVNRAFATAFDKTGLKRAPKSLGTPGKIWAIHHRMETWRKAVDKKTGRISCHVAAVNYGFHKGEKRPTVEQNPGTAHDVFHHKDYSQILSVVAGWCLVMAPGDTYYRWRRTADVYRDRMLAALVHGIHAPTSRTRYTGTPNGEKPSDCP